MRPDFLLVTKSVDLIGTVSFTSYHVITMIIFPVNRLNMQKHATKGNSPMTRVFSISIISIAYRI